MSFQSAPAVSLMMQLSGQFINSNQAFSLFSLSSCLTLHLSLLFNFIYSFIYYLSTTILIAEIIH